MSKVQIGKKAPDFDKTALVDGKFKSVKLDDYKGKWLVLFFYPMDFTFVCPTEIVEFGSKRIGEFRKVNCEVVGCSTFFVLIVQIRYCHLAWTKQPRNKGGLGKIDIPLIADTSKSLAKDYGVLFNEEVCLRGLFIIDPKQIVRQITINDLPVGRNVDEILRLVDAFQFVEKHGEVCPINWHKGQDSMKPDPNGSMEFFEKQVDYKS